MINFTRLYTMDRTELSDIIFTLEMCRLDALKTGRDLEELFEQSNAPEVVRKKNSGYSRANDLEKIITILGGKQYDTIKEA